MSKTVVGLYDTEELARRAADELRRSGFDNLPVHVETRGERASDFTRKRDDDLVHALEDAGVPRDDAEFYSEGVRRGGGLLVVEAPDERAEDAARIMNVHEPVVREQREPDWRERGYTGYEPEGEPFTEEELRAERERYQEQRPEAGEEAHMTEAREEMHVGKREVRGGGARIHKRVVERPVEETVELREEDVDVERRATSETTADPEEAFKEETIEMSETREEPVVEKETHVEGEVVARKTARERSETVRDTVRETEIDIEDLSEGFEEHRPRYREHYESAYGDADYGYDEYEPGYRFGHAYGAHEDYRGREYSEVEPELRQHYERRHGKGTFDRVKDAVRHAYNRVRGR